MESERDISTSENKVEEEEELIEEEQEQESILKRRISTHPLYGLLVDAHMECLKIGGIENMGKEQKMAQKQAAMKKRNNTFSMSSKSELDLFMEAYCLALGKLKEAMEEPQQKSMSFINSMHSQLRELTVERAGTTSSTIISKNKTDHSSI